MKIVEAADSAMYSIGDFSQLTNIAIKTLQKYDNNGKFKAYRTSTGRRYYTRGQLDEAKMLISKGILKTQTMLGSNAIKTAIYIRSYGLDPELYSEQTESMLRSFCDDHNMIVVRTYVDNGKLASDYRRSGFRTMLHDIRIGKIDRIVIKDFTALSCFHLIDVMSYLTDILKANVVAVNNKRTFHPYYVLHELRFAVSAIRDIMPDTVEFLNKAILQAEFDWIKSIKDPGQQRRFVEFNNDVVRDPMTFYSVTPEEAINFINDGFGQLDLGQFMTDMERENTMMSRPHSISPEMLHEQYAKILKQHRTNIEDAIRKFESAQAAARALEMGGSEEKE